MQEPVEAPEELSAREAEGGKGMEAGEEPQKLILHSIPINLDPSATAQPENNLLPVHILLTPAPHATPETPTTKAIPFTLPALQNLKKLVAFVEIFSTTSKTLAALTPHGTADGSGAGSDMEHLDLGISASSTSSSSLQRLERLVWGEHSLPHFLFSFFLFYVILFYFILISLIVLFRFSLIFVLNLIFNFLQFFLIFFVLFL